MAMVRFATTCDIDVGHKPCGARSGEYTSWPSCRECLLHVCPDHTHPGTLNDDDGRETVVCVDCAAGITQENQG